MSQKLMNCLEYNWIDLVRMWIGASLWMTTNEMIPNSYFVTIHKYLN